MGPVAAKTLGMVVDNLEQVLAIEIMVAAQGLDFRREGLSFSPTGERIQGPAVALAPAIEQARAKVRDRVPRWTDDRVMHRDLEAVVSLVRSNQL